jgi:hypothetical protein
MKAIFPFVNLIPLACQYLVLKYAGLHGVRFDCDGDIEQEPQSSSWFPSLERVLED